MKSQVIRQVVPLACLFLLSATMTGCWHVKPDPISCGVGTIEKYFDNQRVCVVAPLACGNGTQERATGGERECVVSDEGEGLLTCDKNSHQQERATGGERECVAGPTSCLADEIEYIKSDMTTGCRPNISCGDGTYERATGGERECVPNDTAASCGSGTFERATGGEREQNQSGEGERATGGERECIGPAPDAAKD